LIDHGIPTYGWRSARGTCTLPIDLMRWLVLAATKPGDRSSIPALVFQLRHLPGS
jgi:hypothetical protein